MPDKFFSILVADGSFPWVYVLVAVAVTAVIVGPLCFALAIIIRKRGYEAKVGSAEQRSAEIVEEATRNAQKIASSAKKEALLDAK